MLTRILNHPCFIFAALIAAMLGLQASLAEAQYPETPYRPAQGTAPATQPVGPPIQQPRYPEPTPQPSPQQPQFQQQFRPVAPPAVEQQQPQIQLRPVEEGQIIARVGNYVVLAGDLLWQVNQLIEQNQGKIPPNELQKVRQQLLQQRLGQHLETVVLYVDAQRNIPKEGLEQISGRIAEQFEKTQLDRLHKSTETSSRRELEAKLRGWGSSLKQQQRIFTERTLATQWLREQINYKVEITHDEMDTYYRQHLAEYQFEAKAKWEELAVRLDRFDSQQAAYRAIAEMGNQVFGGTAFAEVARGGSQGFTAAQGGMNDWTTLGSLTSEAMNQALFTLPVGELSQIIETQTGYHIIRVIERHKEGVKPFRDAQVKIKETIREEKVNAQIKDYLSKVRGRTTVWTIYDDPQTAQNGAASQR